MTTTKTCPGTGIHKRLNDGGYWLIMVYNSGYLSMRGGDFHVSIAAICAEVHARNDSLWCRSHDSIATEPVVFLFLLRLR